MAEAVVISISSLYNHITNIHIASIRLAENSGPTAQRTATAAGTGVTGQQAGRAGQRHGCKRERVSLVTVCFVALQIRLYILMHWMYFVCAELWRRMRDWREVWRQDVENTAIRKSVFFNKETWILKRAVAHCTRDDPKWLGLHQDISVPCFNFQRQLA